MEIALRFLRYSKKIARAYSAIAQKFYSMEINLNLFLGEKNITIYVEK